MSIELPSLEEIQARWREAEQQRLFWQDHYQQFLDTFPDQFVAVHDGDVVAVSHDLRDLNASLKQLNLEPADVWVHYFMTATSIAL
ncbi:MAG: hypothetical protein AB7R89_30335 [Dehalococcoidia bacterium]